MSLGIGLQSAYASSQRAAAVAALRADRIQAQPQSAKADAAKGQDAPKAAPAAAKPHSASATVASNAMAALMAAQERAGQNRGAGEHVADVLGALLERLSRKHPKPPKSPPVVTPPVVTPPVVTPPVIVSPPPVVTPPPAPTPVFLDAPVRQLRTVLESLHERPVSRFPDVPFSQRQAAAGRASRVAPVNLRSMAAVAQNQAALAMLQAMQASMFQFRAAQAYAAPSAFRYSRVI